MIINIDRTSLFTSIVSLSSFVAKVEYNKEGQSLYDVIKIKEQDRFLIEQHIEQSVLNLTTRLKEFVSNSTNTSITCNFPVSFNTTMVDKVQDAATKYIVNQAFSKWLKLTIPDRVKEYEDIAEQSLTDMMMMIYYRQSPKKRIGWKFK
ncbi:MAG: hypothetical protein RRY36_09385 [Bacteroidaceae bacterium]